MTWRDYVRWCVAGLGMCFLCVICYVIGWEAVRVVFG